MNTYNFVNYSKTMKRLTDSEHINAEVQIVMALSQENESLSKQVYYALADINQSVAFLKAVKAFIPIPGLFDYKEEYIRALLNLRSMPKLNADDSNQLWKK